MYEVARITVTSDHKPSLVELVRKIPAIITGHVQDVDGIGAGFRARFGYTLFSLIGPNFELMSRGGAGADGTKWPPLTKEYLAYGRRFGPGERRALKEQAGLGKQHRFGPGDRLGLLTPEQLRVWRRTYAQQLAWRAMRQDDKQAAEIAARIAWATVKKQGARTMLEVYGNRQVQILVDTGVMAGSLQPGVLYQNGPEARYDKPTGMGGEDQIFEEHPGRIVLGSNNEKADWHHNAKNPKRRRRLWPAEIPTGWWREILGTCISGLLRISENYTRRGGL